MIFHHIDMSIFLTSPLIVDMNIVLKENICYYRLCCSECPCTQMQSKPYTQARPSKSGPTIPNFTFPTCQHMIVTIAFSGI